MMALILSAYTTVLVRCPLSAFGNLSYGDLDIIIGEDEGGVRGGEFGVRHFGGRVADCVLCVGGESCLRCNAKFEILDFGINVRNEIRKFAVLAWLGQDTGSVGGRSSTWKVSRGRSPRIVLCLKLTSSPLRLLHIPK